MTADLRQRIADAIAGHWPVTPNNDGTVICHCGERVKADRERQAFREHTADAVLALVQPELDQLRAAATKLRDAANLHGDPGPWLVHQCRGFLRVGPNIPPARNGWQLTRGADLPEERRATAEYVALMHPGVGTALSDWLEDAAEGDAHGEYNPYALATARAILGEVTE